MNYDKDFPKFVNYLRRNNWVQPMNNYPPYFSNSFFPAPPSFQDAYLSMQHKYYELNKRIDELNDILQNISLHSNHRYKRRRLRRHYDDEDDFPSSHFNTNHAYYSHAHHGPTKLYDPVYNMYEAEEESDSDFNTSPLRHKGPNPIQNRMPHFFPSRNKNHGPFPYPSKTSTKNVHFQLHNLPQTELPNTNTNRYLSKKNPFPLANNNSSSDEDSSLEKNNLLSALLKKKRAKTTDQPEKSQTISEDVTHTSSEEEADKENHIHSPTLPVTQKKTFTTNKKPTPTTLPSPLFYKKIKKEPRKKYLIVLDIFNLLYQRVSIDSVSSLIKINPNFKSRNAFIYLRPFLDTFLKELFSLHEEPEGEEEDPEELAFDISVWNSTKPHITKEILDLVMKNVPVDAAHTEFTNYIKKLQFIWTLDQCEPRDVEEERDQEGPKFIQKVDTIIHNKETNVVNGVIYPPVNEFNHWKKENIIIITALNPNLFPKKSNYLCVPPYDVTDLQMEAEKDTSLLSVIQYLKNLLKAKPQNVTHYLNSNPFYVEKKENDFGIIKSLRINSPEAWEGEAYPDKIRQTPFFIAQSDLEKMNRKYGHGRKKSNVLYKPIPSEPHNRYLIIFDLNGTMLHRLKNNSLVRYRSTRQADFSMNGKFAFLRPYMDSFIEVLFDIDGEHRDKLESGFAIGTWTSAMVKNSELMLSQILAIDEPLPASPSKTSKKPLPTTKDYSRRIYFKWARDFCTPIPGTFHETEKNMDRLWNHKKSTYCKGTLYPAVNEFGHWNETNTLIIDDSPHKAKRYPYNAIHIPTYEITNPDSDSETVLLSLIKYLKVLYEKGPANVQTYLRKHPFSKITYDTDLEEDPTLSKQEKFDKLKASTKIRIKSRWLMTGEEEIEKYANGHPKFRASRLQVDLFTRPGTTTDQDNSSAFYSSSLKRKPFWNDRKNKRSRNKPDKEEEAIQGKNDAHEKDNDDDIKEKMEKKNEPTLGNDERTPKKDHLQRKISHNPLKESKKGGLGTKASPQTKSMIPEAVPIAKVPNTKGKHRAEEKDTEREERNENDTDDNTVYDPTTDEMDPLIEPEQLEPESNSESESLDKKDAQSEEVMMEKDEEEEEEEKQGVNNKVEDEEEEEEEEEEAVEDAEILSVEEEEDDMEALALPMTMDQDSIDLLMGMQMFTNEVRAAHPKKEDPKLFKRGIFY